MPPGDQREGNEHVKKETMADLTQQSGSPMSEIICQRKGREKIIIVLSALKNKYTG